MTSDDRLTFRVVVSYVLLLSLGVAFGYNLAIDDWIGALLALFVFVLLILANSAQEKPLLPWLVWQRVRNWLWK